MARVNQSGHNPLYGANTDTMWGYGANITTGFLINNDVIAIGQIRKMHIGKWHSTLFSSLMLSIGVELSLK